MDSDYGFIITRHVNSELTNKYWNNCVKLIRSFYPKKKIVIIDDFSNKDFIKSEFEYKNLLIIDSEYKGRGELLPFIYYLRNKWFDNAVIIHDSLFIHKKIPFHLLKYPVIPLWHHKYDKEYIDNLLRISSVLKNNSNLKQKLMNNEINILGLNNNNSNLCFGVMCYINHNFLLHLENKYKISNLINVIHIRKDRCGLERIMGLLFCIENINLKKYPSLFGDIFNFPNAFFYNYNAYNLDLKNNKIPFYFVKIWSGR